MAFCKSDRISKVISIDGDTVIIEHTGRTHFGPRMDRLPTIFSRCGQLEHPGTLADQTSATTLTPCLAMTARLAS